jgi:hypothetical protein
MIAPEPKNSAEAGIATEFATLVGARLSTILEHVSRIAEVRAEHARRAFLRKAVGITLAAAVGMLLAAVALFAAWQLARGLSAGLAEWTGRTWLGELLCGVLLLGLLFGAGALALARLGPGNTQASDSLEAKELEAWTGLKQSVTELGEEFVRAGKLRERVREHPYVALGAGLAAGIAAAPLLKGALKHAGPLASGALKGVPGLGPILRQVRGPKHPTSSAN